MIVAFETVVVGLLATSTGEAADANAATVLIRNDPIRSEVEETITRPIVLVPTEEVRATVLLQKERKEIRVVAARNGRNDVDQDRDRGVFPAAKDQSNHHSTFNNREYNAMRAILLSK
jgi:hypothetical protein